MSHHFDAVIDPTLDITDAYCFAGAGDRFGPRTVFGMNTSPTVGAPWNPGGYYELRIDTNGDYVEDITFRATFPIGSDGRQYVQVERLTGAAATDRKARGTIITPPDAPVGEVVECLDGIKLFAGQRRRGYAISKTTVQKHLVDHGLGKRAQRLARAAAIAALAGGPITEAAASDDLFGFCHFAARPGDLVAADSFYVGNLKGVGKGVPLTVASQRLRLRA